ncbi:MAG: PHP domain-containing protein, partial [Christensenellales bacterium]|nr:PHP domain-containing protein [Christensenellales bacterium]
QVVEDISLASGLMKELIRHESPGSIPFINWEGKGWTLDGDRLILCVSSAEGANYLKSRGTDRLLETLMNDLFGIRITADIRITGDEEDSLRRIAEHRAREAQALAMDTVRTAESAEKKKRPVQEAVFGRPIHDPALPMNQITEDAGRITVIGECSGLELRDTKNGQSKIVTFLMSDRLGSVNCKLFVGGRRGGESSARTLQAQAEVLTEALSDGNWAKVRGSYHYDDFKREMVLMVNDVMSAEKPVRADNARQKRVELHLHTTFSAMDACATATDLIKQAAAWGHKAVAVTDHGVVQSFPEAFGAAKKAGIKLIPGCEGYLIEDDADIVRNPGDQTFDHTAYVVLDVETTGLNTYTDAIIEIGAVRFEKGVEVAEFSELIDPERPLPDKITEITGITTPMLRGKRTLKQAMPDFARFCQGAVLVAHNAAFDMAFFRRAFDLIGQPFDFTTLDTLALSRNQYPGFRNHKLGTLCKNFGISLTNAHRAVHDARATAQALMKMLGDIVPQKHLQFLRELNTCYVTDSGKQAYHIILLAISQTGITNLYRLVSEGHLHYFHRTPRIPRSLIERYREGLIVGSACESGELFRAMVAGESDRKLERIAKFYDYLEIQPIGNNQFLLREGIIPDEEGLRNLNRRIVRLGEKLNIPVCATGDVHFKEPTDSIYRAILMATKGFD